MDSWLDSVTDGCKGDVLTLLELCMLVEKHVLVHLKGGNIWSSLKTIPPKHPDALKQVDLHLVYLGRGNFIWLQLCNTLLQVLPTPTNTNMTTVIVGTMLSLSPEEDKTLDKLIMSRLGIGLNRDNRSKGLQIKQPSHTVTIPEAGTSSTDGKGSPNKQPSLTVSRIDAGTSNTDGEVTVKQETTIVTSFTLPIPIVIATPQCSPLGTQVATTSTVNEPNKSPITSMKTSAPASKPPATTMQSKPDSLTTTPISLKLVKMNVKPRDRIQVTPEMLDCIPTSKYSECTRELIDTDIIPETLHNVEPSTHVSFNFQLSVHGIRHRQCRYSLSCKVDKCREKFSNIRD